MAKEIKDVLVDALEQANKDGTSMKEYLSNCLGGNDKEVQDEGFFKRKRGRPRKDDTTSYEDRSSLVAGAILEDRKAKARMQDRLNPGATKEEKKYISINADLREIGWDLEVCPGTDSDFKEMDSDIAVLKKEADIKNGADSDEISEPETIYKEACKTFYQLKYDTVTYYNRAKEYLVQKELHKAEELVDFLKDKPKKIIKSYETVEDAYDKLCRAICDVSERDRRGKGAEDPDSWEVEKNGFGMMDGEDYKTYAKRMRSIGRGKDIPKTIRKIDEEVINTERRWRSVAGISQSDFDIVKINFQKTMNRIIPECCIGSNVKISALNRILSYGLNFGERDIAFGCLQPMNPFSQSVLLGGQYGDIVVVWKPYCAVATMTFGDSVFLGIDGRNYIAPSFLTSPSPCSYNPECRELTEKLKHSELELGLDELCDLAKTSYLELQLHGDSEDYGMEAVDRIVFSNEFQICNISWEALAAIGEEDIPLYVKDRKVKISNGQIVSDEDEEEDEQEDQTQDEENIEQQEGK